MLWLVTLLLMDPVPGPAAGAPSIPPVIARSPPASIETLLTAETRRVRAADGRLQRLLASGVQRSKTFAALLAAVNASDVIVYVEPSFSLPKEVAGRILLQAVTANGRYLRVQVRGTLQPDQIIAVIAHELRHALEVADDPAVVDGDALVALYRRIGRVSAETEGYDTDAAQAAGEIVRSELLDARRTRRGLPGA